jgi:hypothetical protein
MAATSLTTFLDNSAHLTWDSRTARTQSAELADRFSYGAFFDAAQKISTDPHQKNSKVKTQILFDTLTKKMQRDNVDPVKVKEIGNFLLNGNSSVMDADERKVQSQKLHQELKAIAPQDFSFGAKLKRTFGLGK